MSNDNIREYLKSKGFSDVDDMLKYNQGESTPTSTKTPDYSDKESYFLSMGFDENETQYLIEELEKTDHIKESTAGSISYEPGNKNPIIEVEAKLLRKKYEQPKTRDFFKSKVKLVKKSGAKSHNGKKAKLIIPIVLVAGLVGSYLSFDKTTEKEPQFRHTIQVIIPSGNENIGNTVTQSNDLKIIEDLMAKGIHLPSENSPIDVKPKATPKKKETVSPTPKQKPVSIPPKQKTAEVSSFASLLALETAELNAQIKSMKIPSNTLNLSTGTSKTRKAYYADSYNTAHTFKINDVINSTIIKSEDFKPGFYFDSMNIITFGIGTTLIVRSNGYWKLIPKKELKELMDYGKISVDDKKLNAMYDDLTKITKAMNDIVIMKAAIKLVQEKKDRKKYTKEELKIADRSYILQTTLKLGMADIVKKLYQDIKDTLKVPTTKEEQEKGLGKTKINPNLDITISKEGAVEVAKARLVHFTGGIIEKAMSYNKNFTFNANKDYNNPMFKILMSQAFQRGNAVDRNLIKHYANGNAGAFLHHFICKFKTTTPGRTPKEAAEFHDLSGFNNNEIKSLLDTLNSKKADFQIGFANQKSLAARVGVKNLTYDFILNLVNKEIKARELKDLALQKLVKNKKTI